jgi:hypothetical protein
MTLAWTLMVLGGAGLAALLVLRVFYPPPEVEVGEKGILDRRLRLGWIRWDEIEGAYQPSSSDGHGLHLKLKLTERLLRRLRRRTPEPGRNSLEIRLDLSRSDLSPTELLHEIMSRSGGSALPQP